jgi:hypothetical protein
MSKRLFMGSTFVILILFSCTSAFAQRVCPLNGTSSGSDINCTTLTPGTTHPDLGVRPSVDYNILNASIGLKYRLWRNLVITGNVLVKLDDNGLRSTTVPLVGASYNF